MLGGDAVCTTVLPPIRDGVPLKCLYRLLVGGDLMYSVYSFVFGSRKIVSIALVACVLRMGTAQYLCM